jgi:hypothetical protein
MKSTIRYIERQPNIMPAPIRANLTTGGTISSCARKLTHLADTKLLFFRTR